MIKIINRHKRQEKVLFKINTSSFKLDSLQCHLNGEKCQLVWPFLGTSSEQDHMLTVAVTCNCDESYRENRRTKRFLSIFTYWAGADDVSRDPFANSATSITEAETERSWRDLKLRPSKAISSFSEHLIIIRNNCINLESIASGSPTISIVDLLNIAYHARGYMDDINSIQFNFQVRENIWEWFWMRSQIQVSTWTM